MNDDTKHTHNRRAGNWIVIGVAIGCGIGIAIGVAIRAIKRQKNPD